MERELVERGAAVLCGEGGSNGRLEEQHTAIRGGAADQPDHEPRRGRHVARGGRHAGEPRECLRAEARVLNLGRTSWHYDGGRRAAAARPPQSRWGARVSDRVAGRAIPDFSEAGPTPRVPAVPSRGSSPEPRPIGTVPEWSRLGRRDHSRPGRPTETCRAPATIAAWSF